jgi:dipeptidyl aminopeptidase/acylaminoacyl peptidase
MATISAERCIGGNDLTEPRLSPDAKMLVYARSASGGAALMLSMLDGAPPRQLSVYPQPRPGRGLGGGCFCWTPDSSAVVYAGADGNLWLQPVPGGQVRRLTAQGPDRTAQAPVVTPDGLRVVHVLDQSEVWIASLGNPEERRLDDGSADFCFDPAVWPDPTADGWRVCWQAWSVPDMPWDGSHLQWASTSGERYAVVQPRGAAQQPRAMPDGAMICVRDDTGWNNVWFGDKPLVAEPFEHAGPTWGLGQRSYAVSPDGAQVAFTRNERGFGRLCTVDVESGAVREVARAVHGQLSWQGSRVAALRTGARTPTQVVVYDAHTWDRVVIDIGPVSGWEAESLVEPELIEVPSRDGEVVHARLYRADEPTGRLMVWLHGGPTDQWQVTFMPRIAYWRSRGFTVLVPDHRGSTGHGRDYQQAMNGQWGDLDVDDTVDAIRHAHRSGWGEPRRTALIGGSAGGFTVLGVLAREQEIASCAVVSYPVTDLFDLAERSHRFERHYTHHLVAPLPASHPVDGPYVERSPVTFAPRIRTPLLMLHGDTDPVVPVEQSRVMAAGIAMAGGIVTLRVYEGEGHGIRQPEHQLDEYRRMGEFLDEHVG